MENAVNEVPDGYIEAKLAELAHLAGWRQSTDREDVGRMTFIECRRALGCHFVAPHPLSTPGFLGQRASDGEYVYRHDGRRWERTRLPGGS